MWWWLWLTRCPCGAKPVSMGFCEEHAKPYERRDEYFGN